MSTTEPRDAAPDGAVPGAPSPDGAVPGAPWPDGAVPHDTAPDAPVPGAPSPTDPAARDALLARAALVAAVTGALAETLDAEVAVGRLAHLLTPAIADWCLVSLVEDDESRPRHRRLRDVGWSHHDPSLRGLVEQYAAARLPALDETSYLARALELGEVVEVPGRAADAIGAVLRPGTAADLLARLAPESAVVAPLRARGRTLGALSLFRSAARPRPTAQEVATVREVAAHAGLALDNARLYRRQREVAEVIQRSMLTDPVEPDHVQIAVRYQPAAEATRVGGDWYDAFLQPQGETVLVIGDVVGHDLAAAAVMGQLRSILRGVAVVTQEAPARLLRHVDQAMRTLRLDTMATAVVARLEQTDDQRRRGVSRLRWSSAGHPPPVVVDADGTVRVLQGRGTDALLGVRPDRPRWDSTEELDRGATVLLYTDGLVERRDRDLRTGIAELTSALADLAPLDLDLDALCDAVLARMLPPQPDDDVAVVAVRLHPQDRPRPAEAGPNRVPPDVPGTPAVEPDAPDAG